MENYEEYAKTARVYCGVYAMKKSQSSSENHQLSVPPGKYEEIKAVSDSKEPKKDQVLGSLTLNHDSAVPEAKSSAKPPKAQGHQTIDKKKWMKKI